MKDVKGYFPLGWEWYHWLLPPPLYEAKIEKIKIITHETFQILQRELAEFQTLYQPPRQEKPRANASLEVQVKSNLTSENSIDRTYHEFQPTNIHNAYHSDFWRWRRVYEWFKTNSQQSYQKD